jgi:serine/threonine protein phosphatase 1
MIYAVGDIHGQFQKLSALMKKIESEGLTERDRFVFIGDYIDRGPQTREVIDYLIELKQKRPNTVFLRGNHDQAMLEAREIFDPERKTDLTTEDIKWWFSCGAKETIASYGDHRPWRLGIPDSHWEFLAATQIEHIEGPYLFVHAGVLPPNSKWTEPGDPRLWIRELFIRSQADFGKIVVFGHTPQDLFFPIVMKNKIGIDTGAAYGGPLTAVVINPLAPFDEDKVKFIYS